MLERGLHVYLRRRSRGGLVSVQGPVLMVGIELKGHWKRSLKTTSRKAMVLRAILLGARWRKCS